MAGAYVRIAVVIENREAVVRFVRAVERMREIAEDSPWMTDLAELADDLDSVRKSLVCIRK